MKYTLNDKEFDNAKDYRKALKESEGKNNAYELWSDEDESKLLELSNKDNMSVTELSDYFKRTEKSIMNRLERIVNDIEIKINYYSNGLMQSEGLYKNDLLRYKRCWYENGQIESKGNFQEFGLDTTTYESGFWTKWYENGQKKFEGNVTENKDIETEWYENGQKKSEKNYNTDRESTNLALFSFEWFEDGQKKLDENFKTGEVIEWYENGQKRLEGQYDENLFIDGQFRDWDYHDRDDEKFKEFFREGKWTEWFENGNKRIEGSYAFDNDLYQVDRLYAAKVEEWIEWYENAQKKIIIDFTNEPFSRHKQLEVNCWHESGQKKFEGYFVPEKEEVLSFNDDQTTTMHKFSIEKLVKEDKWEGQSGFCVEWYEDGQKKTEGIYNTSTTRTSKEGDWTEWYENGQKKYTGRFNKSGWEDGNWTKWHKNGQKKFVGGRKPIKRFDGLCTEWDHNGIRVYERYYENIQNDELDYRYIEWHEDNLDQRVIKTQYEQYPRGDSDDVSKTIVWYENGQKKLESKTYKPEGYRVKHLNKKNIEWYKNGQKKFEGVYEIYNESDWPDWLDYLITGNNPKEYKCKEPVKIGNWRYWFNNGQKKFEGKYKAVPVDFTSLAKSYKDGTCTEWNLDGQIKSSGEFKNGIKAIKITHRYENGIKAIKITHRYENGQLDINGKSQKKSEGYCLNDLKHGKWTTWFENGNISTQGSYIYDKKDGEWLEYYMNGQLASTMNWKDGVNLDYDELCDFPF